MSDTETQWAAKNPRHELLDYIAKQDAEIRDLKGQIARLRKLLETFTDQVVTGRI